MSMSNSFKSLLTSIVLTITCCILIGSCSLVERAPTAFKFKYSGTGTFNVRSQTQAGINVIEDPRLAHALDSFLKVLNIKKDIVVTAKLDSLVFTLTPLIPGERVDFANYADCILVLKNVKPTAATLLDSVAIVFPDTVGLVNKIVSRPGQTDKTYDVTSILRGSPNLSCVAYYRTKRPVPYAKVFMNYSFELSYTESPNK